MGRRGISKTLVVIILVIVAIIAVASAYYVLQTRIATIPKAENLKITDLIINRKTHYITGVTVENIGDSTVTLTKVQIVKVQAKLVVYSKDISPPVTLPPKANTTIYISYKLDPEGADYQLYVFRSDGAAAVVTFGYP